MSVTPDERHEVLRSARELVTAYMSADDLGSQVWQQAANELGDRWQQPGVMAVASVAAGALRTWEFTSGRPRADLLEATMDTVRQQLQPDAVVAYRQSIDAIDTLLASPRDQAAVEEHFALLGELYGVLGVQPFCELAQIAIENLAQLSGQQPLEVLQKLAIWDEESMLENE